MKISSRGFLFPACFPVAVLALMLYAFYPAQNKMPDPDPWTASQLMLPATLQQRLTDTKRIPPLVLSIGPGAVIKGSEDIGAAHEDSNRTKLRQRLSLLPKDKELVIYCGCCPFIHCPNIRPAFALLNELKFTNARLLNIEHNIKTDWISKGYLTNP